MSSEGPFPLLFTIADTHRHEILLLPPSTALAELRSKIAPLTQSSPNTAEFMAKYKRQSESEPEVGEIKVRWAGGSAGRDTKIWPQTTVLTEENCEAVLRLLKEGVGRDVLEVELKSKEQD